MAIHSKHQRQLFPNNLKSDVLIPLDPLVKTGKKIVEILFVFILNDKFETYILFIFYVIQYYIKFINVYILRVWSKLTYF